VQIRPDHPPLLDALGAWLRRVGPILSLAVALAAAPVLFFGCFFELTEGTRWRHIPSPSPAAPLLLDRRISVRLSPRDGAAELAVTCPFAVLHAESGETILPGSEPLAPAPVRPSGSNGIQLGNKTIPAADIRIAPIRDASIVLGGRTYRGDLRIRRSEKGLLFINQLDMEAYLRGVLCGELPRAFHPESFKTLAVAARSYAFYQKQATPPGRAYDVNDGEGSQVYGGVEKECPIADQAVEETTGRVCTWNDGARDALVCTYYSSTCGGLSLAVRNVKPNDPDIPPLRGNVACTDCQYQAPHYRWGPVEFTRPQLTRLVVARYPRLKSLGTITRIRPKGLTRDGRIITVELVGSGGQAETLIGEDFRLAVGSRALRSTHFTIDARPDRFIFKDGRGFGHGMGLCQYGMDYKARRGMDYQKILSLYYPGAAITRLY
jgi:stage II sporulation protein D